MIKQLKKKKHNKNQGNSYIMVVATISFLSILVTAMLVAVAMCYRLKAYDINARDNFYYLEQAMDEIYAGVGADAMKHLNKAYDETIEVLVYFDTQDQSYVTMENADANRVLKSTYIKLVKEDSNYLNSTAVVSHLETFLSNKYDLNTNPEGVVLSVGNVSVDTDSVTIKDVVLKREALYSTYNTSKKKDANGNVEVMAGDTFVQTITTDLVIGSPEFYVNFNTIDSDLSDLYEFVFLADKGVEIEKATSKVSITGNIYAAADFYNKDYETLPSTSVTVYDEKADRFQAYNGKTEKSMYSGFYMDGSDVIISAKKMIVPGTIAAFNSANLVVSSPDQTVGNYSDIWADGIVLGGYSLLKDPLTKEVQGSVVKLRANAYISDDLEINAEASDFTMVGDYYGYNYASTDNRIYTNECITANGGRTYLSGVSQTISDGATIQGQAHYNSSAILVNGQDAVLDLSKVANMYVAGQAYIETSKVKKESDKVLDANGQETETDYQVTNRNNELETVTKTTYDYPEMKTGTNPDDYTTSTIQVDDADTDDKTNIQDYRTGEAISIKSNQLAYIPNWAVKDDENGLYLNLPERLRSLDVFKDKWADLARIPVIKTVISGKKYYYFDFSTEATTQAGLTQDVMNKFIEAYANMFTLQPGETASQGEVYGLTNITDYDDFSIKMLKVNASYENDKPVTDTAGNLENIYSNSAISVTNGTSITIKAKSSSIKPLLAAKDKLDANAQEQNRYAGATASEVTVDSNPLTTAKNVTAKLQSQYKEVKWTLTARSSDPQAVQASHTMSESEITPINYFLKMSNMYDTGWVNINNAELKSGYKIWVTDGDVNVTSDADEKGAVKGMIICRGDVTFTDDVKSFEGIIITGSKIKVNHSMHFMANEEIVKTILRECDESQNSSTDNYFAVCKLFKKYQPIYGKSETNGTLKTELTKSISAVQFEDILSFNNWKKNVD